MRAVPLLRGYQVAVIVPGNLKAEGLEAAGQLLRDRRLLPGRAVDAYQVAEGVGEPLATNHGDFLLDPGIIHPPRPSGSLAVVDSGRGSVSV